MWKFQVVTWGRRRQGRWNTWLSGSWHLRDRDWAMQLIDMLPCVLACVASWVREDHLKAYKSAYLVELLVNETEREGPVEIQDVAERGAIERTRKRWSHMHIWPTKDPRAGYGQLKWLTKLLIWLSIPVEKGVGPVHTGMGLVWVPAWRP